MEESVEWRGWVLGVLSDVVDVARERFDCAVEVWLRCLVDDAIFVSVLLVFNADHCFVCL